MTGEVGESRGNKPHILSNGSWSTAITPAGAGWSDRGKLAITRWKPDATRENWGTWIYVRDLDRGTFWSSAYQPTAARPDRYEVRFSGDKALFVRSDFEIETRTEIVVARAFDGELRRVTLTNHSREARTIELTSYAEVVINRREDDWAHPAFYNLFVETERAANAIVCKRRPRDFTEAPLFAMHSIAVEGDPNAAVECETDRFRFLGRGRSPRSPIALEQRAPLSNTTGPVLDPIVSWRTTLTLAAGASARVVFTTAFASSRHEALEIARMRTGAGDFERSKGNGVRAVPFEIPESRSATGRDPVAHRTGTSDPQGTDLLFFNGFGGFTPDGREYLITLHEGKWTPAPWINVIANPGFGFFVSESGCACTWSSNSRENRLTPWSNDPVADPAGEAIYIRDEASGAVWSPTPLPIRGAGRYTARHGQGYSVFEHIEGEIAAELTLLVPPSDPVKISRLRLTNNSNDKRALSVTYYAEWVLGVDRIATAESIETEFDRGTIFARNNASDEFGSLFAFADAGPNVRFTADRAEFLGAYGDHDDPAALRAKGLSGRSGNSLDPCAALQIDVELDAGEARELVFLLGQGASRADAAALVAKYRDTGRVNAAFAESTKQWDEILGAVQVRTPDAALDLMVNRWLLYQVLSGRVWGRTAFYQASGAFGFRDQLQDVMSLLVTAPHLVREHILRCASRQFVEGDVQHWWHPPAGRGVRTRCSDDRIWLPLFVAQYVETTGDESILDEVIPFLEAPLVPEGHAEQFQLPRVSSRSASLDEHCRHAISVSLGTGAHGLPFIGSCDWNDGLNRVGAAGKGESVWLGWFLGAALTRYAPLVEKRGGAALAASYREHAKRMRHAIERESWDGAWYRRAYYDDGTPLGSAPNEECSIDSIAQTWGVISGVADPARARLAMASLDRRLVRRDLGIVLLLDPPFDKGPKDPGYIKGYVPGIRENGGQYTHASAWVPIAFAILGDGDRATEILSMLNPINHARTPEEVARYKTEPYVLAGDVYSQAPHGGRGGWTWYTGSAGWIYRAAVESLLGFRVRDDHFVVEPCIAKTWPSFEIDYRDGETTYRIRVENASGKGRGVASVTVDGARRDDLRVPRFRDGREHQVEVKL